MNIYLFWGECYTGIMINALITWSHCFSTVLLSETVNRNVVTSWWVINWFLLSALGYLVYLFTSSSPGERTELFVFLWACIDWCSPSWCLSALHLCYAVVVSQCYWRYIERLRTGACWFQVPSVKLLWCHRNACLKLSSPTPTSFWSNWSRGTIIFFFFFFSLLVNTNLSSKHCRM